MTERYHRLRKEQKPQKISPWSPPQPDSGSASAAPVLKPKAKVTAKPIPMPDAPAPDQTVRTRPTKRGLEPKAAALKPKEPDQDNEPDQTDKPGLKKKPDVVIELDDPKDCDQDSEPATKKKKKKKGRAKSSDRRSPNDQDEEQPESRKPILHSKERDDALVQKMHLEELSERQLDGYQADIMDLLKAAKQSSNEDRAKLGALFERLIRVSDEDRAQIDTLAQANRKLIRDKEKLEE